MTRHPLVQLTLARLRSFLREPSAVFWTFGFPLLLSLALGIAFRNKAPEPVQIAVEEGSDAARLVAALEKSPEVKVALLSPAEARRALRSGKAALVVVPGTPRTYVFDPTRPESRLARAVVDDVLQRADGRVDPTAISERTVTEPGTRYIDFLVPGLIGMNLMQSGLWGTGYVIAETRTRKLLKRMVATPMKRSHFLFSFVLMRLLFIAIELPVTLVFARLVFSVGVNGSLVTLAGMVLLGALTFSSLGLLVASRGENIQTVTGLIDLVMMPMFVLSGVFFSSANFPEVIQPIIRVLPLTALNDALRAIMIDGAGISELGRPIAALVTVTLISFATALRIFRWT